MGRSAAGRRSTALALAAVLAVPVTAASALTPAAATTSAAVAATTTPAPTLVHRVRYQGRTMTLRMQHVDVRGDGYQLLLQGEDGALVPQEVDEEQTYVGTVDGDPSATASAIVRHDGTVAGAIAQDRGVDLRFEGKRVLTDLDTDLDPYERGIRWPVSEDDPERVATVAPGAATGTWAFDLGFDLDASYFVDHLGSSVERAADEVDQAMVHLYATYSRDAMLRPLAGRVVLRGSAARSPYAEARRLAGEGSWDSQSKTLDAVEADWDPVRDDGGWDAVMVLQSYMGGGLARSSGFLYDRPFSSSGLVNGSMTRDWNVVRHELGHTLGVADYHTDAPEDETIMSGNHFARFDGTELRAMWDLRDRLLDQDRTFDPAGTTSSPLPPYAALDLLDDQHPGATVRLRPAANDHDANGGAVRLVSVDPASALGGRVTAKGGTVTYVPPTVTDAPTADWFRYVVADESGQTATGVVIARIVTADLLTDVSTWERATPSAVVPVTLTNLGSGLLAGTPVERRTGPPVQRTGTDAGVRWRFVASGRRALQVVNAASRRCLTPADGSGLAQTACADPASSPAKAQRWSVRRHPYGGVALVSSAGTCLTVGGSLEAGTALRRGRCGGAAGVRWQLDPVVGPGSYRVVSSGSDRALAMPVGASGGGDVVARTGADDAASWTFVRRGPGVFALENRGNPGRCVTSDGPWPHASDLAYDGSCVDYADNDSALFTVTGAPDGTLRLVDGFERCLGVDGDADGAVVRTMWCDDRPSQRWELTSP